MTTYQKWMEKFNKGGHESFEEFICNELDDLATEAFGADDDTPFHHEDELTVPPTDPNAGGPSNT